MNQKERMLNALPYKAWLDGLEEERDICKQLVYEFNLLPPKERAKIPEMLKKLLGKTGNNVWIEPPFHCDYGWNIEVGENFFANYNLTVLDVGKVTIGKMHKSLPMYRFTRQDTLSTRKAAIPVMNTESPLRLAIMYG